MDQDNDRLRESAIREALPIYYALLLAILTVCGIYLLIQLQHVLLILFISVLFAATLARPAEYLTRLRIPRLIAVVIIYLAALGIVGGVLWLVALPVLEEISQLSNQIPRWADEISGLRQTYDELREEYPQLRSLDDELRQIGERLTDEVSDQLVGLPLNLARLGFDALSVFFISILLVVSREQILGLSLSLIHPNDRDRWEDVLRKIWIRLGRYLRAKLIVMFIVGGLMYATLMFIDVRFPLLLAVVVALGQLIPRIGPWIARGPLFLIAALDGWEMVIYVAVASVVIENLKGYVISPVVEGNQLDMHPLLVFISILAGGALMGLPGAFVAVPAAAVVHVVFEEVIQPWRVGQFADATDGSAPDSEASQRQRDHERVVAHLDTGRHGAGQDDE